MQKISNILILSIILVLFSLSSVYAEENDNNTLTHDNINTDADLDSITDNIEDEESTNLCSTTITPKNNNKLTKNKEKTSKQEEKDDDPQVTEDDTNYAYYINSTNLDYYFDHRGILNDGYENSILIFDGEFTNKGILTITSPNIKVIGNNSLFNNTVFCVESTNTILSNLNLVLDQIFQDNDYAGILILNDNNTVYNCTINYNVPSECDGIGILAECGSYRKVNGLNLINNTINIVGNNTEDGSVYGVFVDWVDNPVIYGNTIHADLPLRAVDWSREIYGGARMDTVAAFAAENCQNLTLTNNHITTKVTHRGNKYPTLDTVLLYECHNAVVENNYIYGEDYITKFGEDNYLQGIDLYISDNVTIIGNDIHMRTTGGTETMGTAYSIQVTGPSKNVRIAYNNISSVNNGPNLGIYSQNFYGATEINVISNFINITGRAKTHEWALVAGLEVQDSNDLIWNNTIIATNLNDYGDNNNIYGISYSQNTNNNHTYNIQYNTVITNGRYAVSLAGTNSLVVDSIIANNILNTLINSGDEAVFIGNGTNNYVSGNTGNNLMRTLSYDDLPDWLKNHKTVQPKTPALPDISQMSLKIPKIDKPTNPFIKPTNTKENSTGSGLTDEKGQGNMPWNQKGQNNGLKNTNNNKQNTANRNGNSNTTTSNDQSKNNNPTISNNNQNRGSINQKTPDTQKTGPSDTGSSAAPQKAYEVKEKAKKIINKENYLPTIIASAIILLLILAGYKRKNNTEEE